MTAPKKAPVGVFDSGMGGLTVLNALKEAMPSENFIYFGDTAHLPYGTKSQRMVKKYSLRAAEFFRKKNVKLMIIACNTASVYALEDLKAEMPFKVLGVIGPGVKAALSSNSFSIGIIGTYGTVKSGIYSKRIRQLKPQAKVKSRPCPLFVPLVEEGWTDSKITREVAEVYLKDFTPGLDSLILACTHYPLLKKIIGEVIGSGVKIVDSAFETAAAAKKIMQEQGIASPVQKGRIEFYVSDAPELFKKSAPIFLDSKIKINSVKLQEIE